MQCTRCQGEMPNEAVYCPACGASQRGPSAVPWGARRLVRSSEDRKIGGVCGGFAEYFGVDVTLVRVLWIVLSVVPGAIFGGVVAYALAWLVMPEAKATSNPSPPRGRLSRSSTDKNIAGVCGGLAEYFCVDSTPVRLLWLVLSILPGAVVGGVLVYLAAWLVMPKAAGPEPSST